MNNVNSKEYWDERFKTGDWDKKNGRVQSTFFYKLALQSLPEWFKNDVKMNSLSICDIGCAEGDGVGLFSKYFGSEKISGCDFSHEAIEKAKKYYPKCDFFCADLNDLGRNYDVLFSSNTFEHFENPHDAVKNLLPFCKKYFVILLPFREFNRIEEHFFTFDYGSFPLRLGNLCNVYHKEINSAKIPNTEWPGFQILLIYMDSSHPNFKNVTLNEANNGNFDELLDAERKKKLLRERNKKFLAIARKKNEKIRKLREKIEEDRNAIMQIQFEAAESKQNALDAHETYIWKTGAKIEKIYKKIGIYSIRTILEAADYKRSGLILTIQKAMNEILHKKKNSKFDKLLLLMKKNAELNFRNFDADIRNIETFGHEDLVTITLNARENREFIFETIEGITNQTYKNFELIIVHDSFIDKYTEIALDFAKKDPRITIFDDESAENSSNIQGKIYPNGKYVMLIECGTILEKDAVESLKNSLKMDKKANIVYGNSNVIYKFKKKPMTSCFENPHFGGIIDKVHVLKADLDFYFPDAFMCRTPIFLILGNLLQKNCFDFIMKANLIFGAKFLPNTRISSHKISEFLDEKKKNELRIFNDFNRDFYSYPLVFEVYASDKNDKNYLEFIRILEGNNQIIVENCDEKFNEDFQKNVCYVCFGNSPSPNLNLSKYFMRILISNDLEKDEKSVENLGFDLKISTKNDKILKSCDAIFVKNMSAAFSFISLRAKSVKLSELESLATSIKPPKFKVSVIICTYMRETKLSDAIWSVVRQSFGKKNYEIIIVDNSPLSGGARETATYFKEKYAEFDGFIKYVEVLHKGLSFARNAGIWAASGKILLFLDDDVLADYHLIEEIFSAFKYHENAGIIGGQVILDVPFPRPEVARHGYETLWSQLKVQYSTYKEVTQNFEFPYGANFAIRRDLALKIGGFSTSYGRVGKDYSGGEETAMSFKAQQLGYAVGIEPRAKVLHRVDLDRFTKEHVRKTIKSVIFTVYRFFLDMYIDVGWTKKYVRNQVKICLKEARHFKKRGITGIELYYKICYLEAWGDLLKQMEKNKP